ncbi:MAG: hypothetical protein KatS3mg115_1392 [Candidatus Poribacteria bacterium]|nr:MAG: hypothetical protein KatS3mg115_1392 [Candidatus Poribacteria bacterium]
MDFLRVDPQGERSGEAFVPLVVSCESGLEALLIRELDRLGYAAERIKPAKVLVRGRDLSDVIRLNFWVRQANRVFLLLWAGEVGSLEEVREAAGTVPYSRWMGPDQTFGVVGVREGVHDFTSVDIGREVGAAVVEHFLKVARVRVRAHLDAPEVQFFAELSDRHLMILLNTTGEPLTRRHPRRYQHFAPLKPPLAAALLELSSFRKGPPLLDPMAGGGDDSSGGLLHGEESSAGVLSARVRLSASSVFGPGALGGASGRSGAKRSPL